MILIKKLEQSHLYYTVGKITNFQTFLSSIRISLPSLLLLEIRVKIRNVLNNMIFTYCAMSADIDRRFRPDSVAKTILPDITANFYF